MTFHINLPLPQHHHPTTATPTDRQQAFRQATRTLINTCTHTLHNHPITPASTTLSSSHPSSLSTSLVEQFDTQLLLFIHEHPVLDAESVHHKITRLIVEMARNIQQLYPKAIECLAKVIMTSPFFRR